MTSDDLVNNSPFVPNGWTEGGGPAGNNGAGPATPQQYEFRGAYSLEGVYFVNILDRSTGRGQWTRVGAEINGIRPTRYDATGRIVTAVINGQTMDLAMPDQRTNGGQVASAVNSAPGRRLPPGVAANGPGGGNRVTPVTRNVRKVNRIPPPPPPFAGRNSNTSGVPRVPSVVRTQGSTNTGGSSSTGSTVTNNNGVYTSSPTQTGGNGGTTSPTTSVPETPNILPSDLPTPPPPPSLEPPPIPPELQDIIKNRRAPGT